MLTFIAYDILSQKIRQNVIFRWRNFSRVGNLEVQHFIGKKYGKIILFERMKPILRRHTTLPTLRPYFVAICSTIFYANFYQWYDFDHSRYSITQMCFNGAVDRASDL